jgi:hypothetical protein
MSELDAQTFTSSTTYTVVAGAKVIVVECIAAGSGGAGGARNTGTSVAVGPAAGSGGAWDRQVLAASEVGATATVTIGAGGAGGVGRTGSTGSGTVGSAGGVSRFGTLYFAGARRTSGYLSSAGYSMTLAESFGAGAPSNGQANVGGRSGFRGGGGGGGGSGVTVTAFAGGAGGAYLTEPSFSTEATYTASQGGGAAGGTASGGAGGAGAFGEGGGGGGSNRTGTGGAGGAGGVGGGGGSGGAANDDNNGGDGGAGGNAQIKIWVFG